MKSIRYCALLAVVALCSLVTISAQNRPDPQQFRERMLARVREEMDVKDDADWKPISDRVTKVMEAQRESRMGGGMGMMFRRQGGNGGDQNAQDANGGGRRRGGPGGFGEPSPEAEALQKALESKASNDDVKAKLTAYREARKAKRDKLEKSQEDLRKLLTPRQEAAAVSMGLLE